MDIFKNAEVAVESYSTLKTNAIAFHNVSDSAVSNASLRNIAKKEKAAQFDDELKSLRKEKHMQSLQEQVIMKGLHEGQIEHKIGQLSRSCKTMVFKDILFEIFYNALVMDKSFVEENKSTLKGLIDTYVDDNGGYSLLENAIIESNSPLLKKMKSSCDKFVLEVCARKVKEFNEHKNVDMIDFDMNEEEKSKYDDMKDNLDVERISKLVKDKVLTVVKDEKERQETEAKLIQDIEDDLMEDENVVDESTLNAALESIVVNKIPVEDSTLFNALLRDSYHEMIVENVSIRSADEHNIREDKNDSKTYDPNLTADNVDDTADTEELADEIDMDTVLVEALTKYTLMETLYTLKLENYSRENIRKLINKMVNPN